MAKRGILLLVLTAISTPSAAGDAWSPTLVQPAPQAATQAPAAPLQAPLRPPTGPKNFLGRSHPGKITRYSDDGIVVNLREGGAQVVQFGEIWRVRKAFASDEPPGTTVIDYANNRLFVAMPLDALVADLGKKVPMMKLTAPNGDLIYMVASKITDISNALPGLHNPASKTVIGTRDGTQQVLEAVDDAKKIIASAHVMQ